MIEVVLFVCNHNAGRSQMAQAFFDQKALIDEIRNEDLRLKRILPSLAKGSRERELTRS